MYKSIITFKDIHAWKKAYELTLRVYRHTKNFPKEEQYGLINQIRRSSISIISNIAEGFKRKGKKDKLKFYNQAEASLEEVKCQSLLSKDLGYMSQTEYLQLEELENDTGKLLNGWIRSISA